MNVKNVVVGVILVVFGAFVGYSISSKVSAKQKAKQEQCAEKKACKKGKGGKRNSMKQRNFCPQICEQLNLTDSQKAQVKELFIKQKEQRAADKIKFMEQRRAERAQFQAELNKILNAEQQAKLTEIKKEFKAKKAEGKQAKKGCSKDCKCENCKCGAGKCSKDCKCENCKCGAGKCCKKGGDAAKCPKGDMHHKNGGEKQCAKDAHREHKECHRK